MAFCKQCGSQLKDGVAFCKNCGAKIGVQNIQNTNMQNQNVYGGNIYGQMPPQRDYTDPNVAKMKETLNAGKDVVIEKTKIVAAKAKVGGMTFFTKVKEGFSKFVEKYKSDKKFAIGSSVAAVGIVALIGVGIVLATMNDKIAVNECIAVETYGYNTLGYTYAYIDEEAFMEKVAEVQNVKFDAEPDTDEWYNQIEEIHGWELQDMVNISTEERSDLSNGDEVVVNISFDNEKADKYGITFVGETYKYTISGLEELKEYDPFSELKVTFEGIAPNAYLQYDYFGDMLSEDSFSVDKTEGLKEGDEVTITFDGEKDCLNENGYKISETSKKYTCENVDSYVQKSEQLKGDGFTQMKSDAEDCIENYFANNYTSICCGKVQYVGSYILTSKDMQSYDSGNIVYIVYSGKVSCKEKYGYTDKSQGIKKGKPYFTAQDVYMPICFKDVIEKTDGSITYYLESSNICGSTDLEFGWNNVSGYTDGNRMYNDLVSANKINYTYYVSEGLTKFGASSAEVADSSYEEVVGTDKDFIFPNSDSEYLSKSDLEGMTEEELRVATNELYARRGYIFGDEGLCEYFEGKDWYEGTVEGEDFSDSIFNKYETANKDLLVEYAEEKGYR